MTPDHIATSQVFGNCAVPPAHPAGDPTHIVGLRLYCSLHCPHCNFEHKPSAPGPSTGVQVGLFGGGE